jgi:NADH-quinone oxidoreductase subunit M
MTTLHFPWIELAILLPLVAAPFIARTRDPEAARRQTSTVAFLTLLLATMVWLDFSTLNTFEADDNWSPVARILGDHFLAVDELSAPLLPLTALLYALTIFATPRTKIGRFSFGWSILGESIRMAVLSCKDPWGIIVLMAAGMIPPFMELRARGRSTRIFTIHMGSCVALMVVGWLLVERSDPQNPSILGGGLLTAAVLLRSGVVPLHCWMTDLFENGSFGSSLLFVTPMVGAYAAVRLVLPIAPAWALHSIAILSLLTAVYAAGMAVVQTEARRFFCFLFLSHSSLIFVGLETVTPIGLTGALQVWLSVGLALGGFGLTLRSIEARTGRLSLVKYNGLFEHIPTQAAFFLLTGLASVGFPGTIGFVASELLVEGAIGVYPSVGMAVVLAAALNGIAIVRAYFHLFTGTRHMTTIPLVVRFREKLAILTLAALIFGGGLVPQPGVASRYHAAAALIKTRRVPMTHPPTHEHQTQINTPSTHHLTESRVDLAND